jgi:hypothetical protein
MDLHGRVQDGQIMMSATMAQLKENYLRRCKDGTQVAISIKRIRPGKTHQQVKCHWGLVVGTIRQEFANRGMDLATFLNSPTIPEGLEVPADVIQAVLYATCNDVGENGERKTLSQMNTVEASLFFEKCRTYTASAWDIQIPEPNSNWREKKTGE